jgi:hypothetical protein
MIDLKKSGKFYITLAFIIVGLLWLFTPKFNGFFAWFIGKNSEGNSLSLAEVGDMFGSVNALFTALTLAFMSIQLWLQRQELDLQRQELRQNTEELKNQADQLKIQADALKAQALVHVLNARIEHNHSITSKETAIAERMLRDLQYSNSSLLIYNRTGAELLHQHIQKDKNEAEQVALLNASDVHFQLRKVQYFELDRSLLVMITCYRDVEECREHLSGLAENLGFKVKTENKP